MPVEFQCQSCQATLRIPDKAVGKSIKCPQCNSISFVPESRQLDPERPYSAEAVDEPTDLFGSLGNETHDSPYHQDPYKSPFEQSPYSSGSSSPYDKPTNSGSPFDSPKQDPYSSPYTSPSYSGQARPHGHRDAVFRRVQPAAITWLTFAVINSLVLMLAFISDLVEMANGRAELSIVFISVLGFLSLVGIFGAISMLRMKFYPICLAGTVATFISGISCCFLPTLVAIWPFVVLLLDGTASQFD